MASRPRKGQRAAKLTSVGESAGFGSLSKTEQIRYLQRLWDRISEWSGKVPVPESLLLLAEERLAEYRRKPGRARPAHEALNRLTNRHR